MTTSIQPINPARPPDRPAARRSGFTLPEVMIAASLSTIVLAGVLSAVVLLNRTAYSAAGYSELDDELRRGLALFSRDARGASGIHWNGSQSVTLTVPGSGTFTYGYAADAANPGTGSFFRVSGDAASTAGRVVLVRRVASDFTFERYKLEQPGVLDNTAANDLETKLLGIRLRALRTGATTQAASQAATSARFILRNKRVSS